MANPKILIVDDEPFNVDYLEQELEESQYHTVAAFNGQDALDKVQSEAPDLVLLDIMMPVMDGFDVLAHLKANPATRDIPVIVISASNELQSIVKGIQLGAEDYLPKPFEPILLHARISSSLEKKHLRDLQQLYLQGLEHELEVGREIQQGFLPSELPKVGDWEIAAYLKAAREVAGDFYDAFLLPDGNLICVIGDVCGKGVGAALFMALFRSLIRATSTADVFSMGRETNTLAPSDRLSHVLTFINNYVANIHGDAGMFATLFMGIFSVLDGTLIYANCGNEPPLLFGNGSTMTPLRPTGPVVGVFQDANFGIKEISIAKNATLLAFTDGILDALNIESVSFGSERLLGLLNGSDTPEALLHNIENQLRQFVGAADQFDDITMLAIRRNA